MGLFLLYRIFPLDSCKTKGFGPNEHSYTWRVPIYGRGRRPGTAFAGAEQKTGQTMRRTCSEGRCSMLTGQILEGKYKLVKQLGEGGEGSVFLAIHIQTEMFRAVKEIPIPPGEGKDASCHELQMMKRLQNRHLPEIIDVFRQGEYMYLVMEHVRGIPMNLRIADGGVLDPEEVRDTAVQVAEALCYLESRTPAVCHLDIKPSNLILRPDGLIKLVDFGSAWKEKAKVRRMVSDGYAAPEQYRENGAKPDVRTDIYCLGATLFRMISGRCRSWSHPAEDPADIAPKCPPELARIIQTCLQEDPKDRYQSAQAMMDALEGVSRHKRRERGRVQLLGALAMALPAAALCMQILPSSVDLSADESWNYNKLIREARVAGTEDSRTYYRKAVFMEPTKSEAYLCYLSDAQMDGVLSDEEELFLRDTLHTVRVGAEETYEELLSRDQGEYVLTACQIGLAYWYSFDREDARRIAIGWFEKACDASENIPPEDAALLRDEIRNAELYCKLGYLMEKLNSPDEEEAGVSAVRYWKELGDLLPGIRETLFWKDPLTQLKFIREALSTITFISRDLERAGIDASEQIAMIEDLESVSGQVRLSAASSRIGAQILEEIGHAGKSARRAVANSKTDATESDQ